MMAAKHVTLNLGFQHMHLTIHFPLIIDSNSCTPIWGYNFNSSVLTGPEKMSLHSCVGEYEVLLNLAAIN